MDALIVFFFWDTALLSPIANERPPEEFLHKNTVEIHNSPLHFFQTYFFLLLSPSIKLHVVQWRMIILVVEERSTTSFIEAFLRRAFL